MKCGVSYSFYEVVFIIIFHIYYEHRFFIYYQKRSFYLMGLGGDRGYWFHLKFNVLFKWFSAKKIILNFIISVSRNNQIDSNISFLGRFHQHRDYSSSVISLEGFWRCYDKGYIRFRRFNEIQICLANFNWIRQDFNFFRIYSHLQAWCFIMFGNRIIP